eukprot:Skav211557  [mRNA]  locus=scaffold2228:106245:108215:+ [translate_table: standard]
MRSNIFTPTGSATSECETEPHTSSCMSRCTPPAETLHPKSHKKIAITGNADFLGFKFPSEVKMAVEPSVATGSAANVRVNAQPCSTTEVVKCSVHTSLEMSDFFGMTDITPIDESEPWPPWPSDNSCIRLNRDCHAVVDLFESYANAVSIHHGECRWAFGTDSTGQKEPIQTLDGCARSDFPPQHGWKGIEIVWPNGRRFASSMVMAARGAGDTLERLGKKSKLPTKGCLGSGAENAQCGVQSSAIFIEVYDPSNLEHQLLGEHRIRACPECFRLGDRCSKLQSNRSGSKSTVEPWMQGLRFHAAEGGLETTVIFEDIPVRVLCYPETFALENKVWELGQMAEESSNNRLLFDAALHLLKDTTMGNEPKTLAHTLLLLNDATKPKRADLKWKGEKWRQKAAANAATSAELFQVMKEAMDVDVEQQRQHLVQKNAIAEILMDQFGFNSEPVTGNPHGWVTFALKTAEEWRGHQVDECFHGTSITLLAPILLEGLKKPCIGEGSHGQSGSTSKQTIYASPSWHYSAHPVYSPLHTIKSGPHAFQILFKCEVLKGQYRTQKSTLGKKHWPKGLRIDPDRDSLGDLEYLIEDEGKICLKEVMFRQFGSGTDPNVYGELPPMLKVIAPEERRPVEYRWTKMLQDNFRSRNLFLKKPRSPAS